MWAATSDLDIPAVTFCRWNCVPPSWLWCALNAKLPPGQLFTRVRITLAFGVVNLSRMDKEKGPGAKDPSAHTPHA